MSTKIDTKELDAFADKLRKASNSVQYDVVDKALNRLAQEVLNRAIRQTPRDTSNLARSWAVRPGLIITGNQYSKTVYNSADYGVYVEYGHRTRGPHIPENPHKTSENNGWVPGAFMLTKAIEDVDKKADKIVNSIVVKYFGDLFSD